MFQRRNVCFTSPRCAWEDKKGDKIEQVESEWTGENIAKIAKILLGSDETEEDFEHSVEIWKRNECTKSTVLGDVQILCTWS